jgi:hypothetical protein
MPELSDTSIGASISEYSSSEISIYPNPTRGEVTIVGIYDNVSIVNSNGKIISKQKKSNQMINLSDEPNGIYFVYIEDKQGMTRVFRVVKIED